jgi:CubicO group peptidase (beta-lactamase class C family)
MTVSGYVLPPEDAFAHGHGQDGKLIAGGWHTYPEQAAAGLWTTPSDLSRFGLALAAAYRGEAGGPLTPATVKTMLTPVMGDYGLGPGVSGEGAALAVSHGGSNEGFRAFWVIHPVTGDGVAVMTNGDAGDRLMMEIVRAVSVAYDWPDFAPEKYDSVALTPEMAAARVGDWTTEFQGDRLVFTIRREGKQLAVETTRGTTLFTAVSATRMVSADSGYTASFGTGADGKLALEVFGLTLTKVR